jgi:hypothetical protein
MDRLDRLVLTVTDIERTVDFYVRGLVGTAPARHGGPLLIASRPLPEEESHLSKQGFAIEAGPVLRAGATGPIRSISFATQTGTWSRSPSTSDAAPSREGYCCG